VLTKISNKTKCYALTSGRRFFSVYECDPAHQEYGHKIYIIMEADRSVTTVLWSWEY